MFDYTGFQCKSCGKEFSSESDIVVCPECGTPYHRECYLKEGKCINTELHEKHISWKAEMQQKQESGEIVVCKSCRTQLRKDQLFCDHCGTPTEYFIKNNPSYRNNAGNAYDSAGNVPNGQDINESLYPYMINYTDPLCGFNPDEEYEEGLTTKDIGDFVNTSTHYYLPKFKLMKTGKFKISMNFPALIFPELYFANRKMPLLALGILLLKTIIDLPATAVALQTMFADERMLQMFNTAFPQFVELTGRFAEVNLNTTMFNVLYNVSSILNWVVIILFGTFGNYIYYRNVIRKASKIKKEAVSHEESISDNLRYSGGTSPLSMAVFLVLSFVIQTAAMFGVLILV